MKDKMTYVEVGDFEIEIYEQEDGKYYYYLNVCSRSDYHYYNGSGGFNNKLEAMTEALRVIRISTEMTNLAADRLLEQGESMVDSLISY